ncbi:hypothetical protein Psefu_2747 [Pseudomonas fulva 12-X]|uniref:Uncharacterized protein n=1 Tax=Pseudomonas fulva (strain 12-X) TaxID=743720 RepID=F6AH86_PSEF1|nr:hypothetical protein Psefu_2747 [Pseudomonas fulva 12-X]
MVATGGATHCLCEQLIGIPSGKGKLMELTKAEMMSQTES